MAENGPESLTNCLPDRRHGCVGAVVGELVEHEHAAKAGGQVIQPLAVEAIVVLARLVLPPSCTGAVDPKDLPQAHRSAMACLPLRVKQIDLEKFAESFVWPLDALDALIVLELRLDRDDGAFELGHNLGVLVHVGRPVEAEVIRHLSVFLAVGIGHGGIVGESLGTCCCRPAESKVTEPTLALGGLLSLPLTLPLQDVELSRAQLTLVVVLALALVDYAVLPSEAVCARSLVLCSRADGIADDGHFFVLKDSTKKAKPAIQRLLLMGQPLLGVQCCDGEIHRATAEQWPPILEDGGDVKCVKVEVLLLVEDRVFLLFLLDEAIFADRVLGRKGVVFIGVIERRIFDDLAYRLGRSASCLPFFVSEIGDDAGQEVEQLIGVLLLPVGKLVDSGIPNQSGATGFEDTGAELASTAQGQHHGALLVAIQGNSRNESVKPKNNVSHQSQNTWISLQAATHRDAILVSYQRVQNKLGGKVHGLCLVSIRSLILSQQASSRVSLVSRGCF